MGQMFCPVAVREGKWGRGSVTPAPAKLNPSGLFPLPLLPLDCPCCPATICPLYCAADKTVKIWDVVAQTCQHTLTHHSSKVQAVAWNPAEAPVLLSGGFDKRACLVREGRRVPMQAPPGVARAAMLVSGAMAPLGRNRRASSPTSTFTSTPTFTPAPQPTHPPLPPAPCSHPPAARRPAAGHAHARPGRRAHLAGQR